MTIKFLLFAKYFNILVYTLGIIFLLYIGQTAINDRSPLHSVPKHLRKYVKYNKLNNSKVDAVKLSMKLDKLNVEREIFPYKKYDPVRADTPFLVVTAGADLARLQQLVVALGRVRRVHTALLVFSHSVYDDHINDVVRSITFCKTMQIWYPYSMQLNPDRFPGPDSDDYSDEVWRDARLTERKQHWWWTANFVFDRFEWTFHKGFVLFLQETDHVIPDLLYMLQYAQRSLSYFPEVEVLSFGGLYTTDLKLDLFEVDVWRPPFDVGFAFNKTMWRKIRAEATRYCMFDDFNWSYSLLHLFSHFPKGRVDMLSCVFPRVISTALYGDGVLAAEATHRQLKTYEERLFPETVKTVVLFGPAGKVLSTMKVPSNGSGGWADIRDQLLCLDSATMTAVDSLLGSESTTTVQTLAE